MVVLCCNFAGSEAHIRHIWRPRLGVGFSILNLYYTYMGLSNARVCEDLNTLKPKLQRIGTHLLLKCGKVFGMSNFSRA